MMILRMGDPRVCRPGQSIQRTVSSGRFALPRVPRRWSGPLARADQIHRFPAKMALGLGEVFVRRVLPAVADGADLHGERFHDPMCGSGTTALVARAAGFDVSASDLLPTAVVISSANLTRLSETELAAVRAFLSEDRSDPPGTLLWTWPTARQAGLTPGRAPGPSRYPTRHR